MSSITTFFEQYTVLAVFVSVLIEQLGAPIPSLPFLFMAGAAGADNFLYAFYAFLAASSASMLADAAWFYAGRHYGNKVLSLLCKVSISPDTCIRQSELNFVKWGVATLIIAKFVPGLSTLAPPLAGSLGMRTALFMLFNLLGSALWAGCFIAIGIIFNNQIESLMAAMNNLGGMALTIGAVLIGLYIAFRFWRKWELARKLSALPRINPEELAELIGSGYKPVIIDVRAAAVQSAHSLRIPGARLVELSNIDSIDTSELVGNPHVITYCSCPKEVSAVKAAYSLNQKGLYVRALAGGIDGWSAAGHQTEIIA